MAPSHYRIQGWLEIIGIHSKAISKILLHLPGTQFLTVFTDAAMFVDIAVWLIESKDLIQNWNSYSEQDNHNNYIISMGAIDLSMI